MRPSEQVHRVEVGALQGSHDGMNAAAKTAVLQCYRFAETHNMMGASLEFMGTHTTHLLHRGWTQDRQGAT